jgi:flagellar assembly protein FliH
VEPYLFPEAEALVVEAPPADAEPPPEPENVPEPEIEEAENAAEPDRPQESSQPESESPIDYAKLQADAILQDARRQAEELLEKAARDAEAQAKEVTDAAREEGYRTGYAEGKAQAELEGKRQREEQAALLEAEVQKFLEQAETVLDHEMEEHVDELRDLAMAVAEKVVCVSLKSSSEVISRMIQTAIDKRKRKEWVRIYIADCDAKRMTQIPAPLVSALSALSDRVRIIPAADDEPGTCIIEMPDEIVDASAATQLNNIRGILMDTPAAGAAVNLY